ncbi:inositol polyphosphate multikinase [Xenentodon cancila]
MSEAQHQLIMESAVALGKLDLVPGSGAAGVNSTPLKERSGQRLVRPQGPAPLNGCVPLSHQVAGHKYGVDKVGILQHPDGTVLKQVQPPPRGQRETDFYSMVYAEDCCDPCLLDLQNHLPKYYGTWTSPDSPNDLYLKLEDVTHHFSRPCIMDVKLGQQSYDPYASQEKREQQIKKYPLMEEIGFLILGMRVFNVRSGTFDSYDQHYGRGLVKETVKDGLAKFFHNGVCLRKDAVLASIHKVQRILRWFDSQHQLAFYASSLLFVYEGLPPSFSSSSYSSHLNKPPSCPTLMKAAQLLRGGGGLVQTGNAVQEGTGQDKEVAEYNNNIERAAPWGCSLATMYANNGKCGGHRCAWGYLQDKSGDEGSTQTKTSSVPTRNTSAMCEEGNCTCQQTEELNQPAHGNRNVALLEAKDADGERERREQEQRIGGRRDDSGWDSPGSTDVEVKMIDFAHVFPSDRRDYGYVFGLKHLVTVLEQILCDAAQISPPTSQTAK